MAAAEDLDIASLLAPRQGFLSKLGGGQGKGSKWNRRWFVLRDNVLMYFNSPKDFTGFRDKPSGVVLLEECNVRSREDGGDANERPYMFVLSHANGEGVVLAADSEKEMLEWMQSIRTSRLCASEDAEACAEMDDKERQYAAEDEVDAAMSRRVRTDKELASIEEQLASVQEEHNQVEFEKARAEKELKELMARFKLRKSLLHWRHRKLTFSFRALVTIVFRDRIEDAKALKSSGEKRDAEMQSEMDIATASRAKAEAAKRKSEEMLAKELSMKKDGEADLRECEKLFAAESNKEYALLDEEAKLRKMGASKENIDTRDKAEVLDLAKQLSKLKAETEMIQQQLRRRSSARA